MDFDADNERGYRQAPDREPYVGWVNGDVMRGLLERAEQAEATLAAIAKLPDALKAISQEVADSGHAGWPDEIYNVANKIEALIKGESK